VYILKTVINILSATAVWNLTDIHLDGRWWLLCHISCGSPQRVRHAVRHASTTLCIAQLVVDGILTVRSLSECNERREERTRGAVAVRKSDGDLV
jgi:hypothetical protein